MLESQDFWKNFLEKWIVGFSYRGNDGDFPGIYYFFLSM